MIGKSKYGKEECEDNNKGLPVEGHIHLTSEQERSAEYKLYLKREPRKTSKYGTNSSYFWFTFQKLNLKDIKRVIYHSMVRKSNALNSLAAHFTSMTALYDKVQYFHKI